MKKRASGAWMSRFVELLCLGLVVLLAPARMGLAYEKEIVLPEEYQARREKELLKDRFRLDLSLGYGRAYGQELGGIYSISPQLETYLQRLDMEFSKNALAPRLTATYAITPRLGAYVAVPFGLVSQKTEEGLAQLFEEEHFEFGIGDVYAGLYFHLLTETEKRPGIILFGDANSGITKFYSLGDGLWDFTPGVQVRKMLTKSFYAFVTGDYTFRLERNGIDPGPIIGYGGGLGLIVKDGFAWEAGVKAASIGKTKLGGATLFDDDKDIVVHLTAKVLSGRASGASFTFTVGNLDEKLSVETTTVGFELSFPIW